MLRTIYSEVMGWIGALTVIFRTSAKAENGKADDEKNSPKTLAHDILIIGSKRSQVNKL